ncbi:glycosyltransferase family 2 protein [Chitinilyticum piscinae]|uniref:Glycosyltransferase family 2 protein n=1 Tax=Chitinilyticum piscinae TaxID=2866724 RepID=A0A8J7G073_9NEIS|nr:glycosyltransferase family 2 protein [Chitinilyticum piscinae]MBE9609560.1 glycosyltransferase family 2 protein [Chitinilyticum piscinae]
MIAEVSLLLLQLAGFTAGLLALPGTLILWRWTWAARRAPLPRSGALNREPITMLVPAHNEAATLPLILPGLLAAARQDGACRVVVIADNCTDTTAMVARGLGAEVMERNDPVLRGKGHALAWAFASVPDSFWYLVIDADTRLGEGFFAALRRVLADAPAGVQVRYLPQTISQDWQGPLRHWALQGFNTLRPRARAQLGEPVGILGNGFVLAASTLQQVPYRAGSIVEDLEYQLALTRAGLRLAWCEDAIVYGEMPAGEGAKVQRCRWEGGRLALLRQQCLPQLRRWLAGDACGRHALEELLLLPLSLQLLLLTVALFAPAPLHWLAIAGLLVLAAHALQALSALPWPQQLAAVRILPRYLCWKLARLPETLRQSRRNAAWIRSSRQAEQKSAD